jgi:hypothetical protein
LTSQIIYLVLLFCRITLIRYDPKKGAVYYAK